MTRAHLNAAADELADLLPHTTPAPWRLSEPGTDGCRYRALVGAGPRRGAPAPLYGGWDAEVEAYGGYLVAESCGFADRDLMAAMRNVAEHLPDLLRAVASEDPIEVGRLARTIAATLCPCDEHAPNVSPTSDTTAAERVTHE